MEIIDVGLKFKMMLPRLGRQINKIIIHHADARHCTIKDIHSWHLNKGWAGCGYNYFVNKDGKVYKGRPEKVIGAHTKGQNVSGLGICLEGDFDVEEPTARQLQALRELIEINKNDYPTIKEIGLHRDYQATRCPVFDFMKVL